MKYYRRTQTLCARFNDLKLEFSIIFFRLSLSPSHSHAHRLCALCGNGIWKMWAINWKKKSTDMAHLTRTIYMSAHIYPRICYSLSANNNNNNSRTNMGKKSTYIVDIWRCSAYTTTMSPIHLSPTQCHLFHVSQWEKNSPIHSENKNEIDRSNTKQFNNNNIDGDYGCAAWWGMCLIESSRSGWQLSLAGFLKLMIRYWFNGICVEVAVTSKSFLLSGRNGYHKWIISGLNENSPQSMGNTGLEMALNYTYDFHLIVIDV